MHLLNKTIFLIHAHAQQIILSFDLSSVDGMPKQINIYLV